MYLPDSVPCNIYLIIIILLRISGIIQLVAKCISLIYHPITKALLPQVPLPLPAPAARRKHRASFRTKKGISRKPLHKKEIHPAENKASRLRAQRLQDEAEKQEERAERVSSVKNPGLENRDPMINTPRRETTGTKNSKRESRVEDTPTKLPGRATKTAAPQSAPQKPLRSRIPTTSGVSASTSSLPTSSSVPAIRMATPPTLSLDTRSFSEESSSRKYSGKSQKCSPTNIPVPSPTNISKPNFNPSYEPSPELVFVPLDGQPLEGRNKIDEVKRKRKINRPVSNIFDGGSGDLPSSGARLYDPCLEDEVKFTVHVNKTPAPSKILPKTPNKRTVSPIPPLSSSPSRTSLSASPKTHITSSSSPKTHITTSSSPKTNISGSSSPRSSSPVCHSPKSSRNSNKPRQIRTLQTTSNFERRGSLDSSKRSKKGIRKPILSDSNYCNSESSDLERSGSFDSSRSFEKDIFDSDQPDHCFNDPGSPRLCDSPVFRVPKTPLSPLLISTDDLESQKHNLRSPRSRVGSIRVKNVRTRRSWIRSDCDAFDLEVNPNDLS